MRRLAWVLAVLAYCAAGSTPARADARDERALAVVMASLLYEVKQLEFKLQLKEAAYGPFRQRVDRSQDSREDLEKFVQGMDRLRAEIEFKRAMLPHAPRMAALLRPLNVDLQNANLTQAAEVLSKESGVAITVDKSVPVGRLLILKARQVPLATVLEGIAQQGDLKLSPGPNGLVIEAWPSLDINGVKSVTRGKLAPWSDAWGIRPSAFLGEFTDAGEPAGKNPGLERATATITPTTVLGLSLLRAGIPSKTDTNVASLTPLGHHTFVLAQAGKSPQGEDGIWLTIFQLDGVELKPITTLFERAPAPANKPR